MAISFSLAIAISFKFKLFMPYLKTGFSLRLRPRQTSVKLLMANLTIVSLVSLKTLRTISVSLALMKCGYKQGILSSSSVVGVL